MISLGKYGGFKKGVFKYITRYSQNTIKKEVEMLVATKNIYATLVKFYLVSLQKRIWRITGMKTLLKKEGCLMNWTRL